VAKSATGKWVSRVGSSGGGKAYKKTRPSNFYGILIVIVVLGLVATALARYDYQHPSKAAKGPRSGWHDLVRRTLSPSVRQDAALSHDRSLLHRRLQGRDG